MRIFKYPLKVEDRQVIELPTGFEILTVQVQKGVPCLWVKVNPLNGSEFVNIYTYGTGYHIPEERRHDKYLGTYMINEGDLVFHAFLGTES